MTIIEDMRGRTPILNLEGRLDANHSANAEERLLVALRQGEPRLLLDLTKLDYISSAGLRVLLMAAKEAHVRQGKIALCGLNDYVREVLALAGFDHYFAICDTREQALQAIG